MPFVLHHRAAEKPTTPQLVEGRLARLLRFRKRILRVECVVTVETKSTPLEPVGPRPADHADDRTRCLAELRRELVRVHDVLTDGLEREAAARARNPLLVVARPVDDDAVVAAQLPAGVDAASADAGHARRQVGERREVAPRERQIVELRLVHRGAQRVRCGVDEGCAALDNHRFGDRRQGERHVDRRRLADGQGQTRARVGCEAVESDVDGIRSGWQRRRPEKPRRVGGHLAGEARVDVRDDGSDAGQYAALRVGHDALEHGTRHLRAGRRRQREQYEDS